MALVVLAIEHLRNAIIGSVRIWKAVQECHKTVSSNLDRVEIAIHFLINVSKLHWLEILVVYCITLRSRFVACRDPGAFQIVYKKGVKAQLQLHFEEQESQSLLQLI